MLEVTDSGKQSSLFYYGKNYFRKSFIVQDPGSLLLCVIILQVSCVA